MARHRRFCEGFLEACSSAPRNLAEGFRRFTSGEIVRFFRYAVGSLGEVEDYLVESRQRGFIDDETFRRLRDRTGHATAKALNFMRPHEARLKHRPPARRRPPPP